MGNHNKGIKFNNTSTNPTANAEKAEKGNNMKGKKVDREITADARRAGIVTKVVNTCIIPGVEKLFTLGVASQKADLEVYGREYLIERDRKAEARVDDLNAVAKDCIVAVSQSRVGTGLASFFVSVIENLTEEKAMDTKLRNQVREAEHRNVLTTLELDATRLRQQKEMMEANHRFDIARLEKAHKSMLETVDGAYGFEHEDDAVEDDVAATTEEDLVDRIGDATEEDVENYLEWTRSRSK